MMEIKIFVKTSLRGPVSEKPGEYAAVIECMTSKGPASIGVSGHEEETTHNRSVLMAIVKALMQLKKVRNITIYTDCVFVKSTIEQNRMEKWQRSEWKKPSGEDVKHKELWQQYIALADGHKITVSTSKFKDYRDILNKMLAEEKKKAQK